MKCLVVVTHPLEESLCKQLSGFVVDKLHQLEHEVMVEDLYAERFEAVLTPVERESYYSRKYDSSNVTEEVSRLEAADALILIFPTWWFGFPAMLKGWFDRVWGPGIAYDLPPDSGLIKPRLNNLKRVLVVTTLGAPWWMDRFIMRQPVKRVIKYGILAPCAKRCELQFLSLYNSEIMTAQRVDEFKSKIEDSLSRWKK
ncbi:MAG: NAD(P)H-dependent oxidoreductase [Proteobacteria bacterium]|nr:NAD(P)H-dependent oxidoreductase [Pseudomonadota bacterium]